MNLRFPIRLALLALATGCAAPRPNTLAGATAVPTEWHALPASKGGTQNPLADAEFTLDLSAWTDPLLGALLREAAPANLDLALANARLTQARASLDLARSGRGPTVDLSGSARVARSATPGADTENRLQAGADAAWEADLYGRISGGIAAAQAEVAGAEQSGAEARLALESGVATTYAEFRSLQQRLKLADGNLTLQRKSATLNRKRFATGLASELDALNAEALAASTAAQIPSLRSASRQLAHALAVLCGAPPASLLARLEADSVAVPPVPELPAAGIPSDVVRRRPDVRRAETAVNAASARTGVAAAELFPRITLGASAGVQNGDPDEWMDPLRAFWSVGPTASWPLFDRGNRRATVALRAALEEQAVIEYRRVVLQALAEVEDAATALVNERERAALLRESVSANRRAVDLSTRLHEAGQVDFLQVLVAQRSLLAAEDSLAQSEFASVRAWIALKKALGPEPR
jgi:outer membrane protein, multidrug efflux system